MKSKWILLVEDNEDDVLLTLHAFQENDIVNQIRVARDGAEALTILETQKTQEDLPILILLDLKLPKVGGLEVLKKIRGDELMRLLPVVILTSSKEEQDLLQGYSLGANAYIQKPVDFDQFRAAVKYLGIFWLLWNEPPPGIRRKS